MGPIMGSLKSPCTTSYTSSKDTIAQDCLVFQKMAFLQLSRSRCRERRLNNTGLADWGLEQNGHARVTFRLAIEVEQKAGSTPSPSHHSNAEYCPVAHKICGNDDGKSA